MSLTYKYFWQRTPFLKILIPLIIGIIIGTKYRIEDTLLWITILSFITFYLVLHIGFKSINHKLILIQSFLAGAVIIVMAIFITQQKIIPYQKNWFGHLIDSNAIRVAQVIQTPIEKANSYQVLVTIFQQKNQQASNTVIGNAILYIQKSNKIDSLKTGSIIGFSKNLMPIKNSGNPHAFDYKNFQLFKGITHQQYLRSEEFMILDKKEISYINTIIQLSKNKIQEIFKTSFKDTTSYAMSMALLLGDKTDLDSSIYQSFINTGIVHVIAVSGMHLGLLFFIFSFLLKPIKKHNRWIYLLLVITLIWGFCLLVGSAASIVRAAAMVSIYTLGDILQRQKNKYNPIFAAAFILLCYNPLWLWDVGFQLSFAAVLSILIFYTPILFIFKPHNILLKLIWQMIAVTLAAQILTTPLAIYHFQQFPVYFLLANLIAVPLTNGLLILLIAFLIMHAFPLLSTSLIYCIESGFALLTKFIQFIETLPYTTIQSIYINQVQLILLFIFIGYLSIFFFHSSKKYLYISLLVLLFFVGIRLYDYQNKQMQNMLIVYHIPKKTQIGFIQNNRFQRLGDSLTTKEFQYNIRPSLSFLRIKLDSNILIQRKINFISYRTKRIALVDSTTYRKEKINTPIEIDIAVLRGNKRLYISQLLKTIRPKLIIADASTPAWRKKYWKKDCDSLSIPFYDTELMGAFVMQIP